MLKNGNRKLLLDLLLFHTLVFLPCSMLVEAAYSCPILTVAFPSPNDFHPHAWTAFTIFKSYVVSSGFKDSLADWFPVQIDSPAVCIYSYILFILGTDLFLSRCNW